ncbi:MAG: hypothetical protein FWB77_05095 [Treponema sp.]|nr:hypothetical protein [Treponema sp.]
MKRLTISLVIIALIAGSISAQPIKDERAAQGEQKNEVAVNPQARGNHRHPANPQAGSRQERSVRPEAQNRQQQANNVKVEGTLKLEKGFVAIESGENVYLVPMLNRYIGFISSLKEGAKVTVEGRGFRNMVQPVKVSIDGKDYDFNIAMPQGQTMKKQNFDNRRDNARPGNRPDRKDFSHGRKHAHDRNGCRCR